MLTALVLTAFIKCTMPQQQPPRAIDGVFVELDDSYDWQQAIKSSNVQEIFIANIHGFDVESNACKPPDGCSKAAEAIAVLNAAAGKRVYVGLIYDAQFSVSTLDPVAHAETDQRMAHKFWKSLDSTQQARIAGWYLAREWHNFRYDDAKKQGDYEKRLRQYLETLSKGLPKPEAEIVVAPFFVPAPRCSGGQTDVATAAMFARLLQETRVTRVLLQDGFGARNERACKWGNDINAYAPVAKRYAEAVKNGLPLNANNNRIELGVVLEAFGDRGHKPCRLAQQFQSVPAGSPVIVYAHRECVYTGLCQ